jgi:CubicO group peptidase (beta-lactamase class C family)
MSVRKSLVITFFGYCILLCFGCSEPGNSSEPQTVEQRIENQVAEYIGKWDYKPGISVSVYSPAKDLNVNLAYGKASLMDKTDNTLSTPHFIYSISKSFTAASIIKLSNEGKLSLNDKLSKYVDEVDEIYINTDATIDELLCHRSGIYDYTNNAGMFYNNPFSNEGEWTPEKILTLLKTPCANSGNFYYSSAFAGTQGRRDAGSQGSGGGGAGWGCRVTPEYRRT